MGLAQIQLTGYDTVLAVTQAAVNNALNDWLSFQATQVALYYTMEQGEYVPATAATATVAFTATLAPVDPITLYTPQKGSQTVQYTLSFADGSFVAAGLGIDLQQGTAAWSVTFDVDLALQATTIDSLPSNVQTQIQTQVENLDADMFSIQQLWVDLNTAALDSFSGFDGLTDLAGEVLTGVLQLYLKQQQQAAAMIFGYAVQFTDNTALAPTFMPTALNFCVTPYEPISATSHPLDTLNYLVMVQNHALPAYPPTSFGFNFVDDVTITGAVAIAQAYFIPQIVSSLDGILQSISPVLDADAHAGGGDGAIYVKGGQPASFTRLTPPNGNTIATYTYSTNSDDKAGSWGSYTEVSSTYSSSCQIQVGVRWDGSSDPSTVLLSGSVTFAGEIDSALGESGLGTTIPTSTYSWLAELRLQADLTNTGQLDLVIGTTAFDTDPVITGQPETRWDAFLLGLAGVVQTYATGVTQLRTDVQNQVLQQILPALKSSLAGANHFVFPGAKTFLFANPQLSAANDLVADINYQD